MNIAILINNYPPAVGGAEIYAEGLAKRLSKENDVYIITRAFKDAPNQEDAGNIHIRRIETSSIYGLRAIMHFIRAFWMIRKNDIDIIHANHVFSTGFLAVIIGRLMQKPIVIRDGQSLSSVENYLKNPIYKVIVRYTLNRSTVYVDNEGLQEIFSTLTKKEIKLLNNPVDVKKFKPSRKKHDDIVIGYIGRLEEFKGVDYLIEANSHVPYKHKLLIVGDGSQRARLESKAWGNITFAGNIDYNDIHKTFQDIDIFVQPSLTLETPNTVLQAMATGLPIIATSCVANHILQGWENAIVINPRFESEIALAIIYLLSDKRRMEKLGKNAREYAVKNLSWNKHVDDVLKTYGGIVWC